MRIGIIAHVKHAIREPFAGGLEMHTDLMVRLLRKRGHEVTLFASTQSQPAHGLEPICDATELGLVGVAEAPDVPFFKEHHAYLDLMGRLRSRSFDVIHNNSLHYLPAAMADTIPMPMVTTLHTPPFSWLESGIRTSKARPSTFVAISESIRRSWASVTPIDRVILNGVELNKFRFRAEADVSTYAFWHGRIVPEKGLHFAIAAAKLANVELRFAGPVLDHQYFETAIAPELNSSVRYLGHLTHDAISTVLGGAAAFITSPCWEEPYGLVVAEALACGVPVAAFARGAIPEIINSTCGVLAKPDNALSLAASIEAATKLRRADCRNRAETFCNADSMVRNYEQLYAELIDRRSLARNSGRRERARYPSSEAIRQHTALSCASTSITLVESADLRPPAMDPPICELGVLHDAG